MSGYYGPEYGGFRPSDMFHSGGSVNPYSSFPSAASQPQWNDPGQNYDGRRDFGPPSEFIDERAALYGAMSAEPYTGRRFDFNGSGGGIPPSGPEMDWNGAPPRYHLQPTHFDQQRPLEQIDDTWRSSSAGDSWRASQPVSAHYEEQRPFYDNNPSPPRWKEERSVSPIRGPRPNERSAFPHTDRALSYGATAKYRDHDESRSREHSHGRGRASSGHSHSSAEARKTEGSVVTKKPKVDIKMEEENPKEIAPTGNEKSSADNEEPQDVAAVIAEAENFSNRRMKEDERRDAAAEEKGFQKVDEVAVVVDTAEKGEHQKKDINNTGEDVAKKIIIRKDFSHDDIHHFKPIAINTQYVNPRKAPPSKEVEGSSSARWGTSAAKGEAVEVSKLQNPVERSNEPPVRAGIMRKEESVTPTRRISSPVLTGPVLDPQQYVEELSNPDTVDPPRIEDLASELMPKRRITKEAEEEWKMEGVKKTLLGPPPSDVRPIQEPARVGEFGFFTLPVNSGPPSKMHVHPPLHDEPRRPIKPGLLDGPPLAKRSCDERSRESFSPQRPIKPGLLGFLPNEGGGGGVGRMPPSATGASRSARQSENVSDFVASAISSTLAQSDIVAAVAKKGITDILLSNETLKAKIAELYSEEIKKLLTKGVDGGKSDESSSTAAKHPLDASDNYRNAYDAERGGEEEVRREEDEGGGMLDRRVPRSGEGGGVAEGDGPPPSRSEVYGGRSGSSFPEEDRRPGGKWQDGPLGRFREDFERDDFRGPPDQFSPPSRPRRDAYDRSWNGPNGPETLYGPPRDRGFDESFSRERDFEFGRGPPSRFDGPSERFGGPSGRFDGPRGGPPDRFVGRGGDGNGFGGGPRDPGNRFDGPPDRFDRSFDFDRSQRGPPPGDFGRPFGGSFDEPNGGQYSNGFNGGPSNFGGGPNRGGGFSRDYMDGPPDDGPVYRRGPPGPDYSQGDSWKYREMDFGRGDGPPRRFSGRGRRN